MLVGGGTLDGARVVSPRMVHFVTSKFTGERVDHYMGMAMHRGLGPHSRGTSENIRGLGSLASPSTFGHGGGGPSPFLGGPGTGGPLPPPTQHPAPRRPASPAARRRRQ